MNSGIVQAALGLVVPFLTAVEQEGLLFLELEAVSNTTQRQLLVVWLTFRPSFSPQRSRIRKAAQS